MVAGVYVPYFFIQSYALELNIAENMTFNVVAIMNAATFFGRFPYNYLADMYVPILPLAQSQTTDEYRYGGIAVLVPCCFATAIVLFLWCFVHTLAGLIIISATFCFVTGGLVSLPAPTIANMTRDKAEYRTRMGMGYTIAAIGALVGSPIAGAARASGNADVMERWQGAWFVAGGCLTTATLLMVWARILRAGFDMKFKLRTDYQSFSKTIQLIGEVKIEIKGFYTILDLHTLPNVHISDTPTHESVTAPFPLSSTKIPPYTTPSRIPAS